MKFSGICLVMLAAFAGPPAVAQDPSPADRDDADARNAGERLESIVIVGGATDPRRTRWDESDQDKPVLPVVPEDAFLDEPSFEATESPSSR